jgi:hypothetical protein
MEKMDRLRRPAMSGEDELLAETLRRAVADPSAVGEAELAWVLEEGAAGPQEEPDRRGSARLGVEVAAELRDARHPEAPPRPALITDVGPGGVRLRVRGAPPESGDVVLELRRPEHAELLRIPGHVTWSRPERWSTCAGLELARESSFAWFVELRDLAREAAARAERGDAETHTT